MNMTKRKTLKWNISISFSFFYSTLICFYYTLWVWCQCHCFCCNEESRRHAYSLNEKFEERSVTFFWSKYSNKIKGHTYLIWNRVNTCRPCFLFDSIDCIEIHRSASWSRTIQRRIFSAWICQSFDRILLNVHRSEFSNECLEHASFFLEQLVSLFCGW